MMNRIFTYLLLFGIAAAAVLGRMGEVSSAMLTQCQKAVELALSLMGSFCMWGGLMAVAEKAGLTQLLASVFSPILSRLFRGLKPGGEAMRAITLNLSANLLGLGNAATPLGIAAMKAMQKEQRSGDSATDGMALFVVMNTASLQLIPTSTAVLRAAAGSAAPLDILPAVWAASAVSLTVGIAAAKMMEGGRKR